MAEWDNGFPNDNQNVTNDNEDAERARIQAILNGDDDIIGDDNNNESYNYDSGNHEGGHHAQPEVNNNEGPVVENTPPQEGESYIHEDHREVNQENSHVAPENNSENTSENISENDSENDSKEDKSDDDSSDNEESNKDNSQLEEKTYEIPYEEPSNSNVSPEFSEKDVVQIMNLAGLFSQFTDQQKEFICSIFGISHSVTEVRRPINIVRKDKEERQEAISGIRCLNAIYKLTEGSDENKIKATLDATAMVSELDEQQIKDMLKVFSQCVRDVNGPRVRSTRKSSSFDIVNEIFTKLTECDGLADSLSASLGVFEPITEVLE